MRTVFTVRDTTGTPLALHTRVDLPDGKKKMFWALPGQSDGSGLGDITTASLPLYGSEIIPECIPGQTVIVTEGERSADALRAWRIPAFGTVTGASGTPGEHALAPLCPFDVVCWPDHDEPGDIHMARVAAAIVRLSGRVRRLEWGTEKGDDAADFIARGGTLDELRSLIAAATAWTPVVPEKTGWAPPDNRWRSGDTRRDEARSTLYRIVMRDNGPPVWHDSSGGWWRCPFHTEKTPSFKVSTKPNEPFYRCFGCGARGDVFTYLKVKGGTPFKDALAFLSPGLGPIPTIGYAG